ncbi:HK97 family phage prohead protease [Bradyrhizobium sp. MOS002]|uniref:HK97 family phage prohead protease n=1 Tax=Bradyrhizobium sp. MOS002 TaxID=2133947 RepID=UPI000D12A00D|nr:HK97 family phage prohead protease [Bradyrhizobium sp. MOS002]PSO30215.1 HK97 family phage prohead protease [Bradyrhizobium sp. MOS002]
MTALFEFKADLTVDDAGAIKAMAWPFGSGDRVGDWIHKGAFATAKAPLPMLFGHRPNDPVGVWSDIVEGPDGLQAKGQLLINDVARAKEVHALVKSKALTGISIGFITRKATARKGGGRDIKALDLVEISLVTVPMHPGARITSSKSAAEAIALAEAINRAAAALKLKG